jgi:hypothetical protein
MSLPLRPWREHLPQFPNLISPACALREHGSDVRILPRPFWCAPWASKGSRLAYPSPNIAEQGRSSAFISNAQNVNVPSTTITHCPPTFTE